MTNIFPTKNYYDKNKHPLLYIFFEKLSGSMTSILNALSYVISITL